MMTERTTPTLEALAEFAAVLGQAKTHVGGTPYTVLPPDWNVEDLSRFLDHPVRPKGTVTFEKTKSFIDYVNAHKTGAHSTAIYCDRKKGALTAVMNDHELANPGHRDFLAVLPITTSREWKAWMVRAGATSAAISHHELAQFIDDRLDDFSRPSGAEMMELMINLEAKTAVSFHSGVRLDTGSFSFAYSEDTKSTSGTLEIPSSFNISIPVLADDDDPAEIGVRLRYRLPNKVLAFTLHIRNHEEILEKAIDGRVEKIEKETGVPMYFGSFES